MMKLLSAFLLASSVAAFAPLSVQPQQQTVVTPLALSASSSDEFYIDDERRFVMNLIMVGTGGLTVAGFGIPFILFFLPPGAGGGSGGIPAKDALGNDILAKEYVSSKPAGDRSLAQGLKGDAT